jgi:hypothetical protein
MTFWAGLLIGIGLGFVIGLIWHSCVAGQVEDDQVPPRYRYFCPRCARTDGSHAPNCETAVRQKLLGAQGQDGFSRRFQSSAKTDRGGSR